MPRVACTLLSLMAINLVLGAASIARAQGAPVNQNNENSAYMVAYFSNANFTLANAPLGELRLANDGGADGTLWADMYVFDNSQELQECCSCPITADGIISEEINSELLYRPLTGFVNHFGSIKIISSGTGPDATTPTPVPGIRGWETHIQALGAFATAPIFGTDTVTLANYAIPQGPFAVTEAHVQDANLSTNEQTTLSTLCKYAMILARGRSVCRCTLEGFTF